MTPQDCAILLAVAAVYDERIRPASPEVARAKSEAWSAALDSDIPVEWAKQAVVAHYGASRDVIMPADLNGSWRRLRASERHRADQGQALRAIAAEKEHAVPMPDYVRDQIRALRARTVIP